MIVQAHQLTRISTDTGQVAATGEILWAVCHAAGKSPRALLSKNAPAGNGSSDNGRGSLAQLHVQLGQRQNEMRTPLVSPAILSTRSERQSPSGPD